MIYRVIIVALLSAFVSACAGVAPATVRKDWAGTYTVLGTRGLGSKGSITGTSSRPIGTWQVEQKTTDVAAFLGERFGIGYTFEGGEQDAPVRHRVRWFFPEGGLTNPITKKVAIGNSWEQTCRVGKPCLAGWLFSEPWELVPGTWSVEIWVENNCLLRQSFGVSVR